MMISVNINGFLTASATVVTCSRCVDCYLKPVESNSTFPFVVAALCAATAVIAARADRSACSGMTGRILFCSRS